MASTDSTTSEAKPAQPKATTTTEPKVDQKTEGVPVTDIDDPAPPIPEGEDSWDGTSANNAPPPMMDEESAAALRAQREKEKAQGDIRTEEMAVEQENAVPPDDDAEKAEPKSRKN